MSYLGETNEECCLCPLDSARFIMERARHVSIKYGGHFARCIEQSGGSAVDFVELVLKSFPSYRDEAVYDGQRVSFCKRAQILNGLTMFVDYRVPQMLSHKGVLVYSSALKGQLRRKKLIPYGDPDEYKIRAESILTVHLIVNHANEKILLEKDTDVEQRLNAPFVDAYLWKKDENKLIYTNKHHFILLDQYSINYFFFLFNYSNTEYFIQLFKRMNNK